MPSYDFKCKKCSTVVTVKRSISARTTLPKSCKECRGRKFVRVYTPLNFRFERGNQ